MKYQKLKLIFYIVFLIIVFYLGYGLGTLKSTKTKDVFVYDSPTKIRDFFVQLEKILIQDTGLTSDDPTIKRIIDDVKNTPPLAIVGPLIVFFNKTNGDYSVCERDRLKPIIEWSTESGKEKRMKFDYNGEKNLTVSRVAYLSYYSNEGTLERIKYFVCNKEGKFIRSYIDTDGDGLFDRMDIFDERIQTIYAMKGLSYEKVAELPFSDALKDHESTLNRLKESPSK
ncbi:MAG: hypothetical protein LBE12_07240 [Planctomycetaceae bacterium]|jgi:hypothetical protein|nr:hypothetical protein [Planctomycetaceae bacterium]